MAHVGEEIALGLIGPQGFVPGFPQGSAFLGGHLIGEGVEDKDAEQHDQKAEYPEHNQMDIGDAGNDRAPFPITDGDEIRIGNRGGVEHVICVDFRVKDGGFLGTVQFGQQLVKSQGAVLVCIVEGAVRVVFKGHDYLLGAGVVEQDAFLVLFVRKLEGGGFIPQG